MASAAEESGGVADAEATGGAVVVAAGTVAAVAVDTVVVDGVRAAGRVHGAGPRD